MKDSTPARVLWIGTAQPSSRLTQARTAQIARAICLYTDEQSRRLGILYERTRVRHRASVLSDENGHAGDWQRFYHTAVDSTDRGPGTGARLDAYARHAVDLASESSRAALSGADCGPERITHLVTVSCTGFVAPGVDIGLIRSLGLRPTIARVHVGFMGCHGALNALGVATAFAGRDPEARVLVCCVELCSLHFSYGAAMEQMIANALFADGSAAAVVAAHGASSPGTHGILATGSCLFANSEDAMTWRIGDHGFEMTLSPRIPEIIGEGLRPWLQAWLGEQGLGIGDVRSWAIHPGGPRILEAVGESLGLTDEHLAASRHVLGECGNMSSPTVLFILDHLWRTGGGGPSVAIGLGPGLVAEAALFA